MTYAPDYLQQRYRSYDERAVRYRLVANIMMEHGHLTKYGSILDIGGGDAEMEKCLREEYGWEGRYRNYDYVTGKDIYHIFEEPPGSLVESVVVCIETIEHLYEPFAHRLLDAMPRWALHGAYITTPDASVQDVYSMDDTHITPFTLAALEAHGYTVAHARLYDGYYSSGQSDGLVAWCPTPWAPVAR